MTGAGTSARHGHVADGEAGFTPIELLVTITILAVIMGVLAQSLIIGLQTTTATASTLVDATGSRALAERLHTDIAGADRLGVTGGPACAAAGTPAQPQ